MAERNCPDCNVPMESETCNIPNDYSIKGIYTIQLRKNFPRIMNRYSQYTMHICPQCGKVELYMVKSARESLQELVKKLKVEPLK